MAAPCPYRESGFCGSLTEVQREALCASCHRKSYDKGLIRVTEYWSKGPVFIVEGALVLGVLTTDSRGIRGREFLHAGALLGMPQITETRYERMFIDGCYCLTNCTLAFFDPDAFERLLKEDPSFCRKMLVMCCECWDIAERHLACTTAEDRITLFLEFCQEFNYHGYTHEQIAIACDLTRQTVTRLMGGLLKNRPELFSGSDATN